MEQSIVVITFSQGGKYRAMPLINKLKNSGSRVIVIGKDLYAPKGFPRGAVLRRFDDYLDDETSQGIKDSTELFIQALPLNNNFKEAITYDAISLWDAIHYPIFWRFLELMKYIKVAENIMDQEQPEEVVIVGDNDSSLFWLNIESGLAGRRILRSMASWIVDSRRKSLGEEVLSWVANNRTIATSRVQLGRASYWRHRFVSPMLPVLVKYFFKYCDLRRKIGERIRLFGSAAKSPESNKNRICLICASRNEVVGAVPVIRELQRDDRDDVLVIGAGGLLTNSTQKALEREGLSYKSYQSYITGEVTKRVGKGAKSLAEKWRKLKAGQSFKEALNYQGIPLWESLEDDFHQVFLTLLPQTIKDIEAVKHIINVEKPDIVIIMDETSILGGVVALVCESKGLPTLDIEFGAGIGEKIDVPIPTAINEAVDKVVVWGEAMRASAIKGRGISPDRVVVTGSPSFEYAVQQTKDFDKEEFWKQLGLRADRSTILFTSQPVQSPVTPEIREQLVRCVYNAIKGLPDMQFVVKLHPGEGFDLHHRLRQEMKLGNMVLTKDANLYYLFNICELVITCMSTTGLEAMIMDKPVIAINLTGIPEVLPYAESGAAIGVYREEDLVTAVNDALHNDEVRARLAEKRKEFVYRYAYLQDGQAAKRVADLVTQMIEESKKGGTRN